MAHIVTLGCRMNLAESARLSRLLAAEDALVVVNSCAVTDEAARDTRAAIRRARRAHPAARLIVTGCGAEVDHARLATMPEVDGFVANRVKLDARAWNAPAARPGAARSPAHTRAFVAVQTGCDHACTFCVIPSARGPSQSRPPEEVVAEIATLVSLGVREVVLTGVDLTGWGRDLARSPGLGALVAAILRACPDLPRLRLSSLDAGEIDEDLAGLFATEPRLMPHLHLSLQHGAGLILKRMKRRHTTAQALALVERLRAARPMLAVGADLIAGFSTETAAQHEENRALIVALGIVHAHIFPFSARSQTAAARMPQVAPPTIAARAAKLRATAAAVREQWLASLIGAPLSVLAERDGTGHAENFARVRLAPGTSPGELVTITPSRVEAGLLV